jgi:nicotinamidase/pyrazinamidase
MTRALIVVDAQRDFCEGGALPVEGGNAVCIRIADAIRSLGKGQKKLYQYIVGTKDFHIPGDSNGGHFSDNPDYVTTWPEHCVQGTEGSMFHPEIADAAWAGFDAVFYKGAGRPDYSGFHGKAPSLYPDGDIYLLDWLQRRNVTDLDIVGLATDYCVKETAMDAIQNGFNVRIPQALTAAVGGQEARDLWIKTVYAAQGSSLHLN